MEDLAMWVWELDGHWVCLSSSRFFFFWLSHYDWPNPKEKTPHILKVTQYKNFYPRWVVDFFSKSYFVLITFMNVMWQLSTISLWNMAKFAKQIPKRPMLHLVFFYYHHNVKFTQNKPVTMTFPNSQVPNSTFGTAKNASMRQGTHLSFHNFWTNRAKVIQFKVIFVFNKLKIN
jgi:hypothetical protein